MGSDMQAAAARAALSRLADYLETQQQAVTDQWLQEVRRDSAIESTGLLKHRQLLDHLPALFDALCSFLRGSSAADLPDANGQRGWRWRNGCAIGELLRELDVLRHLLAAVVDRFHAVDGQFKSPADSMAEVLVHQFLGDVTVVAVRQFVRRQLVLAHSPAVKPADAGVERGRTNPATQHALAERQQLITLVTHKLRNVLQGLAYAMKVWNAQGGGAELAHAQAQVQDIHELLLQLLDPAMTFVAPQPPEPASPE